MPDSRAINEAKALIHPTVGAGEAGDATDYDMEDYANVDAFDPDAEETYGAEPEGEPAAEPEGTPASAPVTINWEVVAQNQQDELTRLRTDREQREKADFERRVKELPPEEQGDFIMNYYRERERAQAADSVREKQAQTHPLTTLLGGPFFRRFQMEIDDPVEYAGHLDQMEAEFGQLLGNLVKQGVENEMKRFYESTGQQWGVKGLGSAQPRPAGAPRNPVRAQYENARKSMMAKGGARTPDAVADLIRKRDRSR
jgi:hypothetical protein